MPSGTCSRRPGFADTVRSELVASLTPSFSDWWTAGGTVGAFELKYRPCERRLSLAKPMTRPREARCTIRAHASTARTGRAARPARKRGRVLLWHGAGPTGMPAWYARPTNLAVASAAQHVLTRERMLDSGRLPDVAIRRTGHRGRRRWKNLQPRTARSPGSTRNGYTPLPSPTSTPRQSAANGMAAISRVTGIHSGLIGRRRRISTFWSPAAGATRPRAMPSIIRRHASPALI